MEKGDIAASEISSNVPLYLLPLYLLNYGSIPLCLGQKTAHNFRIAQIVPRQRSASEKKNPSFLNSCPRMLRFCRIERASSPVIERRCVMRKVMRMDAENQRGRDGIAKLMLLLLFVLSLNEKGE